MLFSATVFHFILCTILLLCLENSKAESEKALEATLGQFPYQAYIKTKSNDMRDDVQFTLCSGSIIDERWILTTAQCIVQAEESPMDVEVTVGIINRNDHPVDGTFKAQDIYIHDEYNKKTMENNLALIYLDNSIIYSYKAASIEIANPDYIAGDCDVTGWTLNKFPNETLWYSKVTIIPDEECEVFFTSCEKAYTFNKTKHFCSLRPPAEDYGSPFAQNNADQHLQIGIISLRIKCDGTNISLYLDVSQYSDWITATQVTTTVPTIHTPSTVKTTTTTQKPVSTTPTHKTTTTSTRRPLINLTTPSGNSGITLEHHLGLILACTLIIMYIDFKSLS